MSEGMWNLVDAYIGSLFIPVVPEWRNNLYPLQAVVDLWRLGFVPSWDGNIWRLHAGTDGAIVWSGNNAVA